MNDEDDQIYFEALREKLELCRHRQEVEDWLEDLRGQSDD